MIPKNKLAAIFQNANLELTSSAFDDIENILAEYRHVSTAVHSKISDKRRIAQNLKSHLTKVDESLAGLGNTSKSIIQSIYRAELTGQKLRSDIDGLKRIHRAVDGLVESLPRGGRPSTEARDEMFLALAHLFERLSGKQFCYPDKRQNFQGSNFVRGIAHFADRELSEKQLRAGLEAANQRIKMYRNLGKTSP